MRAHDLFDTVPGWGLGPDGKSVLGPTHGGSRCRHVGQYLYEPPMPAFAFSADGKVVRSFLGNKFSDLHDVKSRCRGRRRVPFTGPVITTPRESSSLPKPGAIVLKLPFPEASGLNLKKFNPTA